MDCALALEGDLVACPNEDANHDYCKSNRQLQCRDPKAHLSWSNEQAKMKYEDSAFPTPHLFHEASRARRAKSNADGAPSIKLDQACSNWFPVLLSWPNPSRKWRCLRHRSRFLLIALNVIAATTVVFIS
jgi:hypothetical protein